VAASLRSWAFISRTLAASIKERSTIERTPTVIRDADAVNFDCQTTSRDFGLGRHRREPIADEVSKHVR
jgi:hypothetical protein